MSAKASKTVELFECVGLGVMAVAPSEKEAVSLWRAQCAAEGLDTTYVERERTGEVVLNGLASNTFVVLPVKRITK